MTFAESFKSQLFEINDKNFDQYALEVFNYQFNYNPIYKKYALLLGVSPDLVKKVIDIPFLPISFWKNHEIKSGNWSSEKIFKSSGTTLQTRSQAHVKSLDFYSSVFHKIFSQFYPNLEEIEILALLPSYQEQGDSSLIYMVDGLMKSAHPDSRYYQPTQSDLIRSRLETTTHPKLLFGVTYALLDLIDNHAIHSVNTTVIETGGMKGRRKELIRSELHYLLQQGLNVRMIHSEYGMSELMSQCYSVDNQLFTGPYWFKCLTRDINDPLMYTEPGKTGGLNIIDLANVDTCAFIETQDLGKVQQDGTFEVLGRFDNSDIRGCNLLMQ